MKKIFILFVFATALFSCDKDDNPEPTNPVDQLPSATQTGKNTFGCLLDGKVFTPGSRPNPINCFYQLVDGDYYFSLSAIRDIDKNLMGLGIGAIKKTSFSRTNLYFRR